ncbi:MAG: CDGSH iron-sulfur domain-containing protein [Spirochaetota bacterium]
MNEKIAIEAIPNGPFKVSHAEKLSYCGLAQQIDGDCYLCRCGESKNAPYCDGNHSKAGFKDTNPKKTQQEIKVWQGEKIKTYFNPNACMHVFYCKPMKELRAREGSDTSTATAEEIMKVVDSCPSGALTYELKQKISTTPNTYEYPIEIIEGGEIRIKEEFFLTNFSLQERQPSDKATLCRCGLSKNKPYCDASHRKKENFR